MRGGSQTTDKFQSNSELQKYYFFRWLMSCWTGLMYVYAKEKLLHNHLLNDKLEFYISPIFNRNKTSSFFVNFDPHVITQLPNIWISCIFLFQFILSINHMDLRTAMCDTCTDNQVLVENHSWISEAGIRRPPCNYSPVDTRIYTITCMKGP